MSKGSVGTVYVVREGTQLRFQVGGLPEQQQYWPISSGGLGTPARKAKAINSAIAVAHREGDITSILLTGQLLGYDASLVNFDSAIRMLFEGQVWEVFDLTAYGAAGDGIIDDTVAIQAALDAAKTAGKHALVNVPVGTYLVTSTLLYDTTGLGWWQGLQLRGAGFAATEFINAITGGGPLLRLTSGASISDFQFGGSVGGFSISESGSGANSHGIEYRGVWHQRFFDIDVSELVGAAFKVINTEGDEDSSANVLFDNCRAIGCGGPGFDSTGGTGGVALHTLERCGFQDCETAQVVLEGVGHFQINNCSLTGQGVEAPSVPAVWLKAGSVTNRRVSLRGGEYGNNLGPSYILADAIAGLSVGGMRFVRRVGDSNSTTGILISDGAAGTVTGVQVDSIELEIDDATPAWTFITVGTRLPTIGCWMRVRRPNTVSFVSAGNALLSFSGGATGREIQFEDAGVTTLADSATPTVFGVKNAISGGTTTITSFADGIIGQELVFNAQHAVTVTNGANLRLAGAANFVMGADDVLVLRMFTSGVWTEIGRSIN